VLRFVVDEPFGQVRRVVPRVPFMIFWKRKERHRGKKKKKKE
jgi:hypothetical protein